MPDAPQLRSLGTTLGTEFLGVDVSNLDDATCAWIARALAEHPVLVFREQQLSAADLAAFGRRFGTPQRHHVYEKPPLRPVIIEDRLHQVVCPACGDTTRAPWPAGVPTGTSGPRVHAIAALLTGAYRLSKCTTQQVLADVFGLPMSLGTLSTLEVATAQAVTAPVAEARRHVKTQATAHLDETGWWEGGERAWLWGAVTTWVTVFVVRLSRGDRVAREPLGTTFEGIVVTDRLSASTWYPVRWRQRCWAHLLRDIASMIGRGDRSAEIGEAPRDQAHQMFHWWHRVRDGTRLCTPGGIRRAVPPCGNRPTRCWRRSEP